jgi:O-antigen ligase
VKGALALALSAAILIGAVVDWTPRSWRIAVAMAAITAVAALWALFAREIRWPRQMIVVVPLAAWGILQLALHASVVPYRTEHNAAIWAMCGVTFFLASQIICDRTTRRLFVDVLLWGSTALAILAILQFYSAPRTVFWIFPADAGIAGTFHYRNQFAAFMELMAPFALRRILYGNPVGGAICFSAMLGAVLTSASRTGVILMAGELILFLLIALLRRQSTSMPGLRTIVLVLFAAGAALVAGTERTTVRFGQSLSTDVRVPLTGSTLRMIEERPWFGFGMGTWPAVYPRFASFDMALIANEAHDDWLQWTSEGGIPFTLLMAALVIWIAVPAIDSVWGLGLLVVMAHSSVDYLLREPVLGFAWFAVAGAVAGTSQARGEDRQETRQELQPIEEG